MARRKTTTAAAGDAADQTTALATTSPATPPAAPLKPLAASVYRLIVQGHSEVDIREFIAAKAPGQDADALIVAAVQKVADAGRFESDILLGWCAEAYREIYRSAREAGDLKEARQAVKHLQQLAGFK